jgi:hypothetical protein
VSARVAVTALPVLQLVAAAVLFGTELPGVIPIGVLAASFAFVVLALVAATLGKFAGFAVDTLSRRAIHLSLDSTPRDRDPDAPGHVRPRAPGSAAAA